jgi:putative ABC transport system permease protein
MTMASILLGVTTVTLATGLTSTMVAFAGTGSVAGAAQVNVNVGSAGAKQTVPRLDAAQIEARLRALTGTDRLTARALLQVSLVGYTQPIFADCYRGDRTADASEIVDGRLPAGPGEVAAAPSFLTRHGLAVGDRITLALRGRQVPVIVVGELIGGSGQAVTATWDTLTSLTPDTRAVDYRIVLTPGADPKAYAAAVKAIDPGLYPSVQGTSDAGINTVISFSTIFTILLSIVAALGVFNTVLLSTRERRRDLGMLKSIGMTPRQVVVMTVTSVAGLGAVSGLLGIPLGIVAHRLILDHVTIIAFPESMKNVWHAPQLAGLALAGVAIAVLGAAIPARAAARLTIARVLHNE